MKNTVIDIYTKATDVNVDDDKVKFDNFVDGLKYSGNCEHFKVIYDALTSNSAIETFEIVESYKSSRIFNDASIDENVFKVLNVYVSSSAGDLNTIAKDLLNNMSIRIICKNIECVDKNILKFVLK